ncbi:MAG TPA: hypothetical protein VIX41_11195 [Acidimicrobiales bacterium]
MSDDRPIAGPLSDEERQALCLLADMRYENLLEYDEQGLREAMIDQSELDQAATLPDVLNDHADPLLDLPNQALVDAAWLALNASDGADVCEAIELDQATVRSAMVKLIEANTDFVFDEAGYDWIRGDTT